MGRTRDFRQVVRARAKRDAAFRRAMLKSGIELMLSDESEDAAIGREKLRDYIHATLGFVELGRLVGKGPRSLQQMFSARGDPTQKNLAAVLAQLKAQEGVSLGVTLRRS